MAVGCKDFISKPFKVDELYATIAKHLSLKYTYADKVTEKAKDSEEQTDKSMNSEKETERA